LFAKISGCELDTSQFLGSEGPEITPIISGEYYQRKKASKTSLSLLIEGEYDGNTITPQNITVLATHKSPIQFRDPFVIDSCTASVNTEACTCVPCENGGRGIVIDCSSIVLIPGNGVKPILNVYYPDTSDTCLGPA
jgi:hypothetical protein